MKRNLGKSVRSHLGNLWLGKKIEHRLINTPVRYNAPPIFLVGLPRSGSTLLYQLLTNAFKFSFFSNIASVFYTYPVTVSFLTKPFSGIYNLDNFDSNSGVTKGIFSPSEAGGIYRYWFDGEIQSDEYIRKTCSKMADLFNQPFIWKNLNLSYEISRLSLIFPDALFIFIERELQYVCQSIYQKTVQETGIHIQGFEKHRLQQGAILPNLVEQVNTMNEHLLNTVKEVKFIKVIYAKLCEDPEKILNQIAIAYSNSGFSLKNNREISLKLKTSNQKRIGSHEWDYIKELLKKD